MKSVHLAGGSIIMVEFFLLASQTDLGASKKDCQGTWMVVKAFRNWITKGSTGKPYSVVRIRPENRFGCTIRLSLSPKIRVNVEHWIPMTIAGIGLWANEYMQLRDGNQGNNRGTMSNFFGSMGPICRHDKDSVNEIL